MWCFKGPNDFYVYILPNQQRSFGKTSDIKLEGDATISRLHAIVSVVLSDNSQIHSECTIDDKSKYGTFLVRNKEKHKLLPNNRFILKSGDIIQFGQKDTVFLVLYCPFIIAKSSLNREDLTKLEGIANDLKATLFESWKNVCTHLTVPENLLFTPKLSYALASAKPIVTIAYWEAVLKAIKEYKKLPKIDDFLPNLKEKWVTNNNSIFLPNEERKKLFKGLSFVHFCTNQYSTYAPLITAAGGKSCVYPTKKPLTPRDLRAKNAIVIQQSPNDSLNLTQIAATDYPIIYRELKAAKRRMISDTEIPLAILRCSTEMYCNPTYTFTKMLNTETQECFSSDVIIENTQDVINTNTKQIKKKIIPETCESQYDKSILKKKCFDENEMNISNNEDNTDTMQVQCTSNKKFKCMIIPESCNSQINETSKSSCSFYDQNDDNKKMKCDIVKNIFSGKKSNTEVEVVFDRNKFKTKCENNSTTERQEQQNDKLHENLKINKESAVCKNINLEKQTSLIADEDKLNDKVSSKNAQILHVGFVKETNHSEIDITKEKENNLFGKDYIEVELQDLEKQKLSLVNETRNASKKIKVIEEDKMQTKNNEQEQVLKTEVNKTYLNQGFVDKILRKDVPRGKKFKKMSVIKPEKMLGVDDFVL